MEEEGGGAAGQEVQVVQYTVHSTGCTGAVHVSNVELRFTWNKKMTRSSLQQGCHLMIWSDNDVANDFTTLKDQAGDQAYPPAFLQSGTETRADVCRYHRLMLYPGIEMYREYQRQLWDPDLGGKPGEDEHYQVQC